MRRIQKWGIVLATITAGAQLNSTEACTRVVYQGKDNTVLTARSMDWKEDTRSNLWIFPRGMKRNGEIGKNPLEWTSKYGSVVASAYDICSTDGMNEKGLVANLLWLAESEYPQWDGKKPGLSIAAWVQYILDNFATVDEAVSYVEKGTFEVVSDMMPDGTRMATLHLSISDADGDNAIFEYIGGELKIHHDKSYQVMTNSPVFDQQLALNDYWKNIGGTTFLPGTNRAADRFVRASFYINAIPKVADTRTAVASVFSVIRNTSVPLGITTPNEPNISSTRWRTVSDQKNKVYFFESTIQPNVFWVNLQDVDFSEKAPVKMLDLVSGKTYAGNTANQFVEAKPFKFLGVD
ncbi:linear amide C-N hydrolase [Parabacteroides sp. AM58-2XD]|jgi:penicillin V acylase-like amidase (Ntn superfamily)|uniref:Linear amide C-N hydrolase n=1 Tax=Parabacteroides segnis TaxID=2763058 RepID=A0ABR7DXC2_9BACT|nr:MULTISPECIES: linear amide C-N hydrolase [Parabacteroides]MBC5642167.1 linear amide C-N hydrolase [Parabacteroides segnis]MCM0713217.1 linear amide C-N hydrolase [Parabacteroides sp. TA-V-105]MCM0719112.1 linear amide C-N hydrolase [Parabacteroides sp. W1-Q-101]RGZ02224.1 linear amide C-N hydrolase [Parabacteroides sp. AM58-2XD]GKG72001.1 choloylglycine hydrolase [Parabacteroides goldsteinii]